MFSLKHKLFAAALALVAFAGVAFSQGGSGFWPNWPVVGGASYCNSYTNNVCTQTIPAGPSDLTGNETIPANTNAGVYGGSGNTSPQNVLITPASLNALPITFTNLTTAAASAASISASSLSGGYVIISGGTMSLINLSLPPTAINGQQFVVAANQQITALRIAITPGSGHSIQNNPTILSTNTVGGQQGYRFIFNDDNDTWYRMQ